MNLRKGNCRQGHDSIPKTWRLAGNDLIISSPIGPSTITVKITQRIPVKLRYDEVMECRLCNRHITDRNTAYILEDLGPICEVCEDLIEDHGHHLGIRLEMIDVESLLRRTMG